MQQLNPSEISEIIKRRIEQLDVSSEARNVGTVVSVTDGIIRIHGLADVMYGEMIEFDGGIYGMALNLERDSVGAIVLGDYKGLAEGQSCTCTALCRRLNSTSTPCTRWAPCITGQARILYGILANGPESCGALDVIVWRCSWAQPSTWRCVRVRTSAPARGGTSVAVRQTAMFLSGIRSAPTAQPR